MQFAMFQTYFIHNRYVYFIYLCIVHMYTTLFLTLQISTHLEERKLSVFNLKSI